MTTEEIAEDLKNLLFDKHTHAELCKGDEIVYKHADVLEIVRFAMELIIIIKTK